MSEQECAIGEQVDEVLEHAPQRAALDMLRQSNDATLDRLAARGVTVDKTDVTNIHLAVLLDVLLGDGNDIRRLTYEYRVQQIVAEQLVVAEQQLTKQTLLQGINLPPSQIPRG